MFSIPLVRTDGPVPLHYRVIGPGDNLHKSVQDLMAKSADDFQSGALIFDTEAVIVQFHCPSLTGQICDRMEGDALGGDNRCCGASCAYPEPTGCPLFNWNEQYPLSGEKRLREVRLHGYKFMIREI